jgi:hypothetical protein
LSFSLQSEKSSCSDAGNVDTLDTFSFDSIVRICEAGMRTVLLSWTVGFVGLVSIAGCGALPLYREPPGEPETPTKAYTAPVKTAYEPTLPRVTDKPWPTAPAIARDATPIAVPPRTIDLTAQVKVDPPDVTLVPEIAKKIEVPPEGPAAIPAVVEKHEVKDANAQVVEFDNIKCVTGQVQQFRKTWRLRYAPCDQDDPHGGSVLLEGAGLDRLRDGQRIRVQGVLIPPMDRTSPARYRVRSMEILE